ncbi:type 1 glutamine amidotransferase [Mumia flava]|uniref:type 1 glutamine amidotransferase n=1 Tax=Mumia flava TaxID=1348852 RepID=UPI000A48BD10|nr:type 1 glutamine amidotransferase [Mumia flava]
MQVLVIAHDHVSPAGHVGQRLEQLGVDLDVHQVVPAERFASPDVEPRFPDPTDYDAVVVLGSPWSVYDRASVGSWVVDELAQLRRADAAGVPVLGICFGGQLLAEAHGGTVAASSSPEIGWTEVTSTDPRIVADGPWFQWHFDAWTVPPGAVEIARNAAASQAFVLRRNLAVQFHPELDGAVLAGWLASGDAEAARARGIDPDRLVRETAAAEERSRARAHALVDGFLAHVAGLDPVADPGVTGLPRPEPAAGPSAVSGGL